MPGIRAQPESKRFLDDNDLKGIIRYARYSKLHEDIYESIRQTKLAGEPCCLAIEGDAGVGKTTLVQDFASAFPRRETDAGTDIPALYIETPSPVTVKGMACYALHVMGDPAWDRGTLHQLNSRLRDLIEACHVEIVILDDFHHLIDQKTRRVLYEVADWLKALIKITKRTFVVVGQAGAINLILSENEQLSRLFQEVATLKPFLWNEKKSETIAEFSTFIQYVERLKLPISNELPRSEALRRIYYATRGNIANVINLFNMATAKAGDLGQDVLELNILAAACRMRLQRHARLRTNPFECPHDEFFVPPQPPYFE